MFGLAGIGLKLLGIGRWIKEAAGAVFRAILTHPKEAALIALACACAWLWRGWNGEQTDHAATRLAHKAELQRRDEASAKNLADQIAAKAKWEAQTAQLAKENRLVEDSLRATLGARADAHAGRMRFNQICRRATAPAPGPDPAPLDNGPGADAVVLERRDYDTLIDNTVRLKAAHEWGEALILDGVAMPMTLPEPAFGTAP